jgi:hypothetical protein
MLSCQVKVISWNPVCAQSALTAFQRYRRQDDRNAGLRAMLYLQRYNEVDVSFKKCAQVGHIQSGHYESGYTTTC